MPDLVFMIAAAASVVTGLFSVTRRNPVYSAVWLLGCFLAFAVIYLWLDATFLAAIHVLVYTGAILVLFLFVIMLLNLKPDELGEEMPLRTRLAVGVFCAALFVFLAVPLYTATRDLPVAALEEPSSFGSTAEVGGALFRKFGLPFEMMSVLILAAIFGGVALAKKKP